MTEKLDCGRGGAPVGHLADLEGTEARLLRLLRLWSDGSTGQARAKAEMIAPLGPDGAGHVLRHLDGVMQLLQTFGRRPLMRHAPDCLCVSGDEACLLALASDAADGAREDALMRAMLLVRPDLAPALVEAAQSLTLVLRRAALTASRPLRDCPVAPSAMRLQ